MTLEPEELFIVIYGCDERDKFIQLLFVSGQFSK